MSQGFPIQAEGAAAGSPVTRDDLPYVAVEVADPGRLTTTKGMLGCVILAALLAVAVLSETQSSGPQRFRHGHTSTGGFWVLGTIVLEVMPIVIVLGIARWRMRKSRPRTIVVAATVERVPGVRASNGGMANFDFCLYGARHSAPAFVTSAQTRALKVGDAVNVLVTLAGTFRCSFDPAAASQAVTAALQNASLDVPVAGIAGSSRGDDSLSQLDVSFELNDDERDELAAVSRPGRGASSPPNTQNRLWIRAAKWLGLVLGVGTFALLRLGPDKTGIVWMRTPKLEAAVPVGYTLVGTGLALSLVGTLAGQLRARGRVDQPTDLSISDAGMVWRTPTSVISRQWRMFDVWFETPLLIVVGHGVWRHGIAKRALDAAGRHQLRRWLGRKLPGKELRA